MQTSAETTRFFKRVELLLENEFADLEWAVGERLFRIILFGNRYEIDKGYDEYRRSYEVPEEHEDIIVVPLMITAGMSPGGFNLATGRHYRRGADGFAICDLDEARKWTLETDPAAIRKRALEILDEEIEAINHYLNGDIYSVGLAKIYECECCGSELPEKPEFWETITIDRSLPKALEGSEIARILREEFGIEDVYKAVDEGKLLIKRWDSVQNRW